MGEFDPEAVRAVAAAAEALEDVGDPRVFRASNGLVLRLRPVPPLLFNAIARSFKKPNVPQVLIKDDDGERWEENPNDPDYLQALEAYPVDLELKLANFLFLHGTKVESIPPGMEPPESDVWIEEIEENAAILGIPFKVPHASAKERYLSWLRCYAVTNAVDAGLLEVATLKLMGISDQEVSQAVESFRSGAERRANNGGTPAESSPYGDNVPVASAGTDY